MAIELPTIISAYFNADQLDAAAVAACFTEEGRVTDERTTYTGREAIRQWKTAASTRYRYTAEPLAIEERDGKTIVKVHLAGDFPGSPVDVRFSFVLSGERIASLEIAS